MRAVQVEFYHDHKYYGRMSNVVSLAKRMALPKTLTVEEARVLIGEIAENDERVMPTAHCYLRMEEREITLTQVLRVLRRGQVTGDPEWTDERNWKVRMRADTAGQLVNVVVAIDADDMGNLLLVITVF